MSEVFIALIVGVALGVFLMLPSGAGRSSYSTRWFISGPPNVPPPPPPRPKRDTCKEDIDLGFDPDDYPVI